ncbi:hypothetical protein LX32DRAFT_126757 [Colletotrichum zoysiae]|uniref:Uncharacterized protein n=1 Tax=Colletotrichum zoysiae TaxID=1216348 RepID=A0AAD9LVN3_9PEZI|nr:hypothetical protein LX32DRAFT_126757 [Colletotrichum zoysiae]
MALVSRYRSGPCRTAERVPDLEKRTRSEDYKGDKLQHGFKVHKQSRVHPLRTRQDRIGILRSIWTRGPQSLHIGGRMILALFLRWPIRQHRRSCLFARVEHAVCRYVLATKDLGGKRHRPASGGICFVSSTSRAQREGFFRSYGGGGGGHVDRTLHQWFGWASVSSLHHSLYTCSATTITFLR